ncbi:hypothetical protein BCR34DRAFT_243814 [Clohesyomyces aquaticus]|uniref:Uncharacterized protein n=1 Tax=Clohesyomyces aquaticus TaxID=1231657 RepID=A0A1Y1Y4S4_9PLEO|nr:hypothetical protein BCR34DRAFT_243814 [Clohesyomyces aquaticus]
MAFNFLSNNPPTRAKDSKKPRMAKATPASATQTPAEPPPERKKSASNSTAELEKILKDSEDEWYSCTSSEDEKTPVDKTSTDGMDVFGLPSQLPVADRELLLQYMPALFNRTLPPCGLEIQVAYESVCARLRWRWLENRGQKTPLDVCHVIKGELDRDERVWPVMSNLRFTKKRKPWRRENVFRYELRWIKYFIREAQVLSQSPGLMTESELSNASMDSPVPPEVGLNISRSDVLGMWNTWNSLKRARIPSVPDLETGMKEGLRDPGSEVDGKTDGIGEASAMSSTDSDLTVIASPSTDGSGDNAQQKINSGHG